MAKMGRPRLASAPLAKLSLMVPPEMLEELDSYVAGQQRERPMARLTRSDVCRDILEAFLMQRRKPGAPNPGRQEDGSPLPPKRRSAAAQQRTRTPQPAG
jgi:hypothetical protein